MVGRPAGKGQAEPRPSWSITPDPSRLAHHAWPSRRRLGWLSRRRAGRHCPGTLCQEMRGEVDSADTPDGRAVPRQPLLGFGAASAAQVDEELEVGFDLAFRRQGAGDATGLEQMKAVAHKAPIADLPGAQPAGRIAADGRILRTGVRVGVADIRRRPLGESVQARLDRRADRTGASAGRRPFAARSRPRW